MNNTVFTAYSNIYSTAMMQNTKHVDYVAAANKTNESRFSALVRLLRRH